MSSGRSREERGAGEGEGNDEERRIRGRGPRTRCRLASRHPAVAVRLPAPCGAAHRAAGTPHPLSGPLPPSRPLQPRPPRPSIPSPPSLPASPCPAHPPPALPARLPPRRGFRRGLSRRAVDRPPGDPQRAACLEEPMRERGPRRDRLREAPRGAGRRARRPAPLRPPPFHPPLLALARGPALRRGEAPARPTRRTGPFGSFIHPAGGWT